MNETGIPSEEHRAVETVAAIDIGANSIRMVIAQVAPDGRIEVIEQLHRAVRLGHDVFRRERLGGQAMRGAIAVLGDFRHLIDLYHVDHVRAVATSAVREATNSDTFLDRIYMATGFNVEVIDTSEESRLTVTAVREALGDSGDEDDLNRGLSLIIDVGGGSTLLTILREGEIATSQSLRLGSIRIQEILDIGSEPPERAAKMLKQYIQSELPLHDGSLTLKGIDTVIAVGGDARFAAEKIGRETTSPDLFVLKAKEFDKFVSECTSQSVEELGRRNNLPFAEAETLNPALLVYQQLLKEMKLNRLIVSLASMRDGLMLEFARQVTGQEDPAITEGTTHAAMAIAEKYHVDMDHALGVADLATQLFDKLRIDHGLNQRHRLLLEVAAILHEIGRIVGPRAHHKHSYYLISNSEIFGLSREEVGIVAHIARYHRQSAPKPSHVDLYSLPRERRIVINKLAALLRVADAMVSGYLEAERNCVFLREGDDLIVQIPGGGHMLEKRTLSARSDMFEDIYGLRIRLEDD